ncbi:MAG: transglutaminase family protein [Gemmatimonadota bacterium]|nr:transglutaminase family protein [Gemmatimonadota bacterium]
MHSPAVEHRAYLVPTGFLDADHAAVVAFATGAARSAADAIERATALYYAVRDRIRYDAHDIDLRPEAMRASSILARGAGFCVAKAVVLAAAARALEIPSRLGFADVRNHLATESMRRAMGTDLFVFHGYAELWLQGRWVKVTPAFNKALCERFGVAPLEFNGRHDSLFQQVDRDGKRYMEYVCDRGQCADLPLDRLRAAFEDHYPALVSDGVYAVDRREGSGS